MHFFVFVVYPQLQVFECYYTHMHMHYALVNIAMHSFNLFDVFVVVLFFELCTTS